MSIGKPGSAAEARQPVAIAPLHWANENRRPALFVACMLPTCSAGRAWTTERVLVLLPSSSTVKGRHSEVCPFGGRGSPLGTAIGETDGDNPRWVATGVEPLVGGTVELSSDAAGPSGLRWSSPAWDIQFLYSPQTCCQRPIECSTWNRLDP